MKLNKFLLTVALFFGLNLVANDSFTHIRNATAKINYAGVTFLLDPYLAPKDAYEGFVGTVNSHLRNPRLHLPFSTDEILKGVDAVVVTHTHDDHWDKAAQELIPKDMPIFVQHSEDKKLLKTQGFKNITIIFESVNFKGVELHKTGGAHGSTQMYANAGLGELLGDAMGVVFKATGHKSLYVVGDTIWTADVNKAFIKHKPEIIVLNAGYAQVLGFENESIIMGKNDVKMASELMPNSLIISVHMDAVNHAMLSRDELREFIKTESIKNAIVPNDGEK